MSRLIDAKELINSRPENLNTYIDNDIESAHNKGWNACNIYWCNTIDRQPKVGEWIPVSERLPEGENEVLITVNGKFNNITFDNAVEKGFYCEDDGWIIDGYLDWITPDVIAWMPLPPAFKGE